MEATRPDEQTLARWRAAFQEEVDAAAVYRAAAQASDDPHRREVLERMAADEDRHAELWRRRFAELGEPVEDVGVSMRGRLMVGLASRFADTVALPTMARRELVGADFYDADALGAGPAADERRHAAELRELVGTTESEPIGRAMSRLEHSHRAGGGNALRAAVLGVNDGLVSNLALVMGVAGAGISSRDILITGLAGLVAGAGSMAMGEWISVTSSRELYEREIEIERAELEAHPEEELAELSLIFEQKGLSPREARGVAESLMADPEAALDTLAREELGIDPEELGGSAWVAAASSFALFVVGAIVPVLPFVFLEGGAAVLTSLAASVVGLFGIGAAITLLTGRSALRSGLRQLAFGLAAAAVTYGIGTLFDITV